MNRIAVREVEPEVTYIKLCVPQIGTDVIDRAMA
jgi:hypothetical protein